MHQKALLQADYYHFLSREKANGYGATADNTTDCSSSTQYNYLSKNLNYTMMFAGFNTGYAYAHQANRRISYILTEVGNKSFRLGGKKGALADYAGYTAIWEPDYTTFVGRSKVFGFYTQFNTDAENTVYLYNDSGISDVAASNAHYDKNLGYIRLKSYTSINPYSYAVGSSVYENNLNKGDFWYPVNTSEEADLSDCSPNSDYSWLSSNANTATITSSVYLPGAGSNGQGQVIYFGTVAGYALVRQSADIGTTDNATKIYNNDKIKDSRPTMYVVLGSNGVGTTVLKGYSSSDNDSKVVSNALRDAGYNLAGTPETYIANDFYKICIDTVYKYQETDLAFTLGYCSRWRMAMGDVTHNGTTEETRSYEKYYTASHSGGVYTRVPSSLNGGGVNNLYYNVWFPGEFYNLTDTATKDGVTVAVGYTVAGSSYMKPSSIVGDSGYYGTALGSIYNDAVLAAYTNDSQRTVSLDASKGGKTTIFKNLLYYKNSEFLIDENHAEELHARANMRFTCVDINTETTQDSSGTSGTKRYYAYYGDNYGRVFRSLVATSTATFVGGSTEEEDSASENIELVSAIPDTHVSSPITSTSNNGLQEITVDGKSMNEFFKEVVAIDAEEDIVIITGTPNQGAYNIVVVGTRDDSNNWTWKKVRLGGYQNEIITSSFIVGGWYYVGVTDGGSGKWVGAVSLQVLKEAANNETIPPADTYSEVEKAFIYTAVGDVIYAIGGRETV